ncbi:MAG: YaaA family protein [Eubacteriales bacterium]|nr:YaaA family protein [Eubacteriales bacterium]
MKIILSPAKTLRDQALRLEGLPEHREYFPDERSQLDQILANYSEAEMQGIWKTSDQLSARSYERWWQARATGERHPALGLYHGAVYQNLEVESCSPGMLTYLDEKLRIISGLYGLLAPSTPILPYRLEMASRFNFELDANAYSNLYDYWGSRLADALVDEIEAEKKSGISEDAFILNLASNEYAKAVQDQLQGRLSCINVYFYVLRKDASGADKRLNLATYAKIQRGHLLRHLAAKRVENRSALENYSDQGFVYSPELSGDDEIIYLRDER